MDGRTRNIARNRMPCQTFKVRRCQRLPELLCTSPIPRDWTLEYQKPYRARGRGNPRHSVREFAVDGAGVLML
jgi:hypothetical protein